MKNFFLVLIVLATAAVSLAMVAPAPSYSRPIELYANVSPAQQLQFQEIDSSGNISGSLFSLPGNSVFVLTDVIVTPNVANGLYEGNIDTLGGNENRIRYRFDTAQQMMLHLTFETGLVFADLPVTFLFATAPNTCSVRLLGSVQRR